MIIKDSNFLGTGFSEGNNPFIFAVIISINRVGKYQVLNKRLTHYSLYNNHVWLLH